MKVITTSLENERFIVMVTLEASEVREYLDRAGKQIASTRGIPGFRPGHAPRNMVERSVGKDVVHDQAAKIITQEVLEQVFSSPNQVTIENSVYSFSEDNTSSIEITAILSTGTSGKESEKSGEKQDEIIDISEEIDTEAIINKASSSNTLWICTRCNTENPLFTKYCLKCGNQLTKICPECNQNTSLVSTGICGECGYDYETAAQRKHYANQIEDLEQKLTTKVSESNEIKQKLNTSSSMGIGGSLVILAFLCPPMCIVFNLPRIYNDPKNVTILWTISIVIFLLPGIVTLFMVSQERKRWEGQVKILDEELMITAGELVKLNAIYSGIKPKNV